MYFKMLVSYHNTTYCHNPEDSLHHQCSGNLKYWDFTTLLHTVDSTCQFLLGEVQYQ